MILYLDPIEMKKQIISHQELAEPLRVPYGTSGFRGTHFEKRRSKARTGKRYIEQNIRTGQ